MAAAKTLEKYFHVVVFVAVAVLVVAFDKSRQKIVEKRPKVAKMTKKSHMEKFKISKIVKYLLLCLLLLLLLLYLLLLLHLHLFQRIGRISRRGPGASTGCTHGIGTSCV